MDAHYANTMHSKIDEARAMGLPVKAENWGGKMHMKSLVADDKYVILAHVILQVQELIKMMKTWLFLKIL